MDAVFREAPQRRRIERIVPWISIAVLLAGIGVAVWKWWPSLNQEPNVSSAPTSRNVVPVKEKAVPLSKEARRVAGRFILTAVVRENLAEAWTLSGPQIRQDLTRKEWLSGNIPVVPFTAKVKLAPMKVDYSFENHALVEVVLIPPEKSKVKPETFWLELKNVGAGANKHWVVWSWVPRVSPPIPVNPAG